MNTKFFDTIYINIIILISLMIINSSSFASIHEEQINQLLNSQDAPEGVVFELLTWGENTWDWAVPLIADYRIQLRKKFPDIDIAIVSHGSEQFQLVKSVENQQLKAINQLRKLGDEGIDVHVCGTHSGWKDIPVTEYVDVVDVSPSGPAQINDYIKIGYIRILIDEP